MKVTKSFCLFVLMFLLILTSSVPAARPKKEILIGALFSITGDWSTLGNSSAKAIQIAAEDVNAYFNRIGLNLQVRVIMKDTKLDPAVALKKLQELAADGVQLVIGPQSSSEIVHLRTFADQKGILLLSQSSTAGALSISEDNIFRLCPDDSLEGEAISALMYDDGVRAVVPIWRDDAGNRGLEASTRRHFTESGGTMFSGVQYAANTNDFSARLNELENQIKNALAQRQQNTNEVGVYLAAFDEVVSIFKLAATNSTLSSVRWYGSDGVALNQGLLADSKASDFASNAYYPNPLPGLPMEASSVWRPIVKKIQEQTGAAPEAFALGAYDAVWIVARTVALKPGNETTPFVKQHIRGFASSYFGATGWTVLNPAGDRKFGNFDFWAIRDVRDGRNWVRVASYNSATETLSRK